MQNTNYGKLLNTNALLHRKWFIEMCSLLGIQVLYYSPKKDKEYDGYGELLSGYNKPELVGCIFEEHPTQQSLKKMGWVSELQENSSVIHVPYDLDNLQVGALFAIPSGIDNTVGRLFRVIKMTNSIVYPSSITCEIAPEYENTFDKEQFNHKHNDFNLLAEED